MSLSNCITKLLGEKQITAEMADQVRKRVDDLKKAYKDVDEIPESEIQARAERDVLQGIRKSIKKSRFDEAKRIQKRMNLQEEVFAHESGAQFGLASQLYFTRAKNKTELVDLESLMAARKGEAFEDLGDVAKEFEADLFGNYKNEHSQRLMAESILGINKTSEKHVKFAEAWKSSVEKLMARIGRAGVPIPKIDDYGLPMRWSRPVVRSLGETFEDSRAAFIEKVMPALDFNKMRDKDGNQLVVNGDTTKLEKVLAKVHESIYTGGANKKSEGTQILNMLESSRILHFKPEKWMDIYDEFGDVELGDLLIGHIDNLASELALIEKFGADYDKTFDWILQKVQLATEKSKGKPEFKKIKVGDFREVFDQLTGRANAVEEIGSPQFAQFMSTARNWTGATKLHSAVLSSVTDWAYVRRQANLMDASFGKMVKNYLGILSGLSKDQKQRMATRLGLGIEWMASNTARRYQEFGMGSKTSQKAISFTLNASGLTRSTNAWKVGFAIELNASLARKAKQSFDQLDAFTRQNFEQFGISAKDWDVIRQSVGKIDNEDFIDPKLIKSRTDISAEEQSRIIGNLNGMIMAVQKRAIPEPDAQARAAFKAGTKKGTLGGEIVRSGLQFKSFTTAVMLQQLDDIMYAPQLRSLPAKARYAVALGIQTTILGALAIQMKEVTAGRDPREMNEKFWMQAVAQGGSLGFAGDTMVKFAESDGLDKAVKTMGMGAGPVSMLAAQLAITAAEGIQSLTGDDDQDFGKEFTKLLKHNTPKTWYTKLFLERVLFDQMQRLIDPDAEDHFDRIKDFHENVNQNQFYWQPGDIAPGRLPDMENAIGQ